MITFFKRLVQTKYYKMLDSKTHRLFGDWCNHKALKNANQALDFAIDVDVPDENIIKRMEGRRACVSCGATYHIVYNPTKTEGICDVCGKELILREDDKPQTVKKRLTVYHDQTQPLINYYKEEGILKTVDGTQSMEDVFNAIVTILGA